RRLVEYIGQVIEQDPLLYLTYVLFSEYFTVIAGPEWLALLEKNCGIPASSMSVVGKHSELDKEHTREDIDVIDRLMNPSVKPDQAVEVLDRAFGFYESFAARVGSLS
ncbi:MAG TPA: hypothetical protein VFW62_12620, partial [bacterium]|nr:hypothetical protein [bacterium]